MDIWGFKACTHTSIFTGSAADSGPELANSSTDFMIVMIVGRQALLPTSENNCEEREVLAFGSIRVAILPSYQDMKIIAF